MKIVVFGGTDREEKAARKVCDNNAICTAVATVDGKPCHAGNAYQANGFKVDDPARPHLHDLPIADCEYEIIVFECSPNAALCSPKSTVIAACDHHNPGDEGYALGPDLFWEASSIGQLCMLLNVDPTEELLMVAAGDHCPAAAYKGLCPGIDVEKFKTHRIDGLVTLKTVQSMPSPTDGISMVAFTDDREEVTKAIAFANDLLILAPESHFAGVKDLRPYGKVDQLPEAALITGHAYLSQIPDTNRDGLPTGHVKVNLGGDNSPETVAAVMQWLNDLPCGLSPAYGVPSRGFAGRVFSPALIYGKN